MHFHHLKEIIAKLRDPVKGCPWDLKQTHETLLPYLIEETYEAFHAIKDNNSQEMKEELGDMLLQIFLHAQLASEKKSFSIEDVFQTIADKMIRRHPHVFAEEKKSHLSMDDLHAQWAEAKKKEGKTEESLLPKKLLYNASLASAYEIGKKSHKIKFDWGNVSEVLNKVKEELGELEVEIKNKQSAKIQEELGDLLFSVAQLSRHLGSNPEDLLRRGNEKFLKRFHAVEKMIKADHKNWDDLDSQEKEKYWKKVKTLESR